MPRALSDDLQVPIFSTRKDGIDAVRQRLRRSAFDPMSMAEVEERVRDIIVAVREQGDEAVVEFERRFDWQGCTKETLQMSGEEIEAAVQQVPPAVMEALELAKRRLEMFHQQQIRTSWFMTDESGTKLGQLVTPLESVGLYVPSARAALPSTVLHVGVPAKVAGVKRFYFATPPHPDGSIPPVILAAAKLIGVDRVFRIGGAVAAAAFAFGTKTVPKVDKIAGPGNIYWVVAKKLLYGIVGIDLLAGPSEVAVIADDTAPLDWVALELLAQAEHGSDSIAVLLTPSEKLLRSVSKELQRRLQKSPRRRYLEPALRDYGALVLTRDLDEAIALANDGAFEHVALMVAEPMHWVSQIKHAGAVFLGATTSVAFGDYLAGPSHVLPTGGTARFSSGLSVDDFLKRSSLVALSSEQARLLAEAAAALAEVEDLPAHAQALRERKKKR